MRAKTNPLANGDSVIRTSAGMQIEMGSGSRISWNTNLHRTYDGMTISNAGLRISRWGDTRTIQIAGLHRIFEGSSGAKLYDHSITSLNDVSVTGQRVSGTRTLSSGTVRVYSNNEKTTTDVTFAGLQWRNAGCCYPTAGTITAVTSGSKYSTVSINFDRSSCGQVSVVEDGKSSTATLQQCE
jgi:hypothetical protein